MKSKKLWLLLCPALLISLNGCSTGNKEYPLEDYVAGTLEYKEDFKILQLTDLHLSNKDVLSKHFSFIDLTIKDANPDLIVVTGDLFTFGEKQTAKDLFSYLDSHGKPWTVVFGNHDEQAYFSVEWMTSYLNNFKSNCIFKDLQDDNVYGNCNFVINLTEGSKVKQQLFFLDSNRHNFKYFKSYDYIKPNQIKWYEDMVNYTKNNNGGETVSSLAFFHIPLQEFETSYDLAKNGSPEAKLVELEKAEKNEGVASSTYNSKMFDKVVELGSTKGMFVGHDHINTFCVDYKGVYLCYGVKSTDLMYFDERLMGGQVINMNSLDEITINRYFHTYAEVK